MRSPFLRCLSIVVAAVSFCSLATFAAADDASPAPVHPGVVRTYYIAADEVDWNYLPGGKDMMMGMKPAGYAKAYTEHTADQIGTVYRKAIYREYTDGTFAHRKPRPASDAYLGIVGPVIHAEVGDTIRVVFRNNGTHPYSIHPHGVEYATKGDEGSAYADGVPESAKAGDAVPPGGTYTYTWFVPERAGPGPNDPSSIVWLYHSHVHERQDVNSGLIGVIIVTRRGMARPDGTPKDVDREVVGFYMGFDEFESHFMKQNIARFVRDKSTKFNPRSANPTDPENGNFDPLLGTGFVPANVRLTINGYQYASGPMPTLKKDSHVRWYVVTLGEGINAHTPHWHGNTVLVNGQRTDVVMVMPAQMVTADMVPDATGIWMFHCHFSEHMEAGMSARYQVVQ
jgi:FtsP/CotA-like multicopper oxidase with cupredoxin domain